MFSSPLPALSPPCALNRREWLRVGGLGALGLSLPMLLNPKARAAAAAGSGQGGTFGRAKSCIILFLSGGPPQHETFDPKPDAPQEIRGTFGAIPTNVPGLHFSELLPRTARIADKMSIIRSMTTENNSHSTSGHFMLTGYMHPSKAENVPAGPTDWPSIASVAGALRPSERSPLSSVALPERIYNTGNITWPGQDGGFMGAAWHPMMMKCDPTAESVRIEGLSLAEGMSSVRLSDRHTLLQQMDASFHSGIKSAAVAEVDHMHQKAFDLLHAESSRRAFEIERESAAMRDAYGRTKFGQSTLLARRLVEAGVRLVQVNWSREKNEDTGSPLWDTHSNNGRRTRDVLCPAFDQTFSTLVADLSARGLLDETLVVVMGEFGRSPKINKGGGRDHWGSVFSVALAGAGVGGGHIIGASDAIGGMPKERPVRPPDLAATIFHLLGIEANAEFIDPMGRPRRVTDEGVALKELVGV
jgi:uncharacterized protein (DUF1501 family)